MSATALATMPDDNQPEFELNADDDQHQEVFELEALSPDSSEALLQGELYLPEGNPEQPEVDPQIELDGMARPVYAVEVSGQQQLATRFQHADTLLDSLEAQGVEVHYQCREGYCGSCRTQLLEGEVHYQEEPMACIADDEILPCCCIPKTHLKIKID